jgi:hypothetical protein
MAISVGICGMPLLLIATNNQDGIDRHMQMIMLALSNTDVIRYYDPIG